MVRFNWDILYTQFTRDYSGQQRVRLLRQLPALRAALKRLFRDTRCDAKDVILRAFQDKADDLMRRLAKARRDVGL